MFALYNVDMCGRYTLTVTDGLKKRFGTVNALPAEVKPNYNIAPTQHMPVVVRHDGKNHFEVMKWGITPVWALDKPGFHLSTINTRAETILEKPMWKRLVTAKRCLVPATGFYEWQKQGSKKQPFYIKLKKRELFAMAGIYDSYTDKDTGEVIASYSIITTEPNKIMTPIHNRMPVILDADEEKHWLNETTDAGDLIPLLNPYDDKGMELYEVDSSVGAVKNNSIELTYPLNSQG